MNFRHFFLLAICLFATSARAADEPIMQIRLQQTWCYGPCPIDEITLNSNGDATFSGVANSARDGFYRGQIASDKFAALARFLQNQNFFELRSQIGRGNIDASDTIVSVARGYNDDAVVFRVGGNEKLRLVLVNAIVEASNDIVWKKDEIASRSGVKGSIRRDLTPSETRIFADRKPPVTSLSAQFFLVTLTSRDDSKISFSTRSDGEGRIQIFAPPGRYDLSVRDTNTARSIEQPKWIASSQTVEVKADQFVLVPPQLQLRNIYSVTKPKRAAKVN